MDVRGYPSEEEKDDLVGQNEFDENIAADQSEPEEGRERDKKQLHNDADGTGENVEGDLDGDGDLSNPSLNENDEDIMGDEAHSAPAGGDFQEGDFDGEERSRGEEGGCREMVNEGEEEIDQLDLIDDGHMEADQTASTNFVKV